MDDDDLRIEQTVRDGQRNKEVMQLVHNWCSHAEIDRSPGRGLIEEMYDVPIGHMGLRCKHVGGGSLHCWLLEDAAYEFYLENCKNCTKRKPVGLPNITTFIGPREKAAAQREIEKEEQRQQQAMARARRKEERALIKAQSGISGVQLLDIVDELDADGAPSSDTRIEEMARLAPEAFSPEILEYLYKSAVGPYLSWREAAARSLIVFGVAPEWMITLCINTICGYSRNEIALSYLLDNVDDLSDVQFEMLIPPFVNMALPSRPSNSMGGRERSSDANPIKVLYASRSDLITKYVDNLLSSPKEHDAEEAARTLLALEERELFANHTRTVIAKLLRRRSIFPEATSRSDVVYYLREASVVSFKMSPKEADNIIQSLLLDQSKTGREEAFEVYAGAMHHRYEENVKPAEFHGVAFQRLLWAAVENPSSGLENRASRFFQRTDENFAWLAAKHMDALIGAAATLSEKLILVDKPSPLDQPKTGIEELQRSNERAAINSLQGALIAWAAMGASGHGKERVIDFLELYNRLPDDQINMRANTVAHFASLMSDVSNMQAVLSPLYRALMDENAIIRASAANVLHDTNYRISQHFPDLLFEAYAALLSDPVILVHQTAVRYMKAGLFPEHLKPQIKSSIANLILVYARDPGNGSFLVDCIRLFVRSFCKKDEIEGQTGAVLTEILGTLENVGLYDAVDKLAYSLVNAPNYIRVVLKSLRSDFTRGVSIDDCLTALLQTPASQLAKHGDELRVAFYDLEPFATSSAMEGYVLITALTRAGRWEDAKDCSQVMLDAIPEDQRHKLYRLEVCLLAVATRVEAGLAGSGRIADTLSEWVKVLAELEDEVGNQSQRSGIPRILLS